MAELFEKVLRDLSVKPIKAISKGLGEAGDELLRLSGNLVPLKDAPLRNSGKRTMVSELEVEVKYSTPYASYQHEGVRSDGSRPVRHYTTAGTGKKYLENPLIQNLSKWGKIIGINLSAGIKR